MNTGPNKPFEVFFKNVKSKTAFVVGLVHFRKGIDFYYAMPY